MDPRLANSDFTIQENRPVLSAADVRPKWIRDWPIVDPLFQGYGEYTLAKNLMTSPYRPEYVLSHAFDSYPTGARTHYSLTAAI